MLLNLERR